MNNLNVCSTHSYLYHGPSLYTDGHNQQPKNMSIYSDEPETRWKKLMEI
jgi:hypothetical protein